MCRPFAIFVLPGPGGVAPREENPVFAIDAGGFVHLIRVPIVDLPFHQTNHQNAVAVLRRINRFGGIGVAARPLALVRGECWDAVSPAAMPDGVPVNVTGMERLTLLVKPISTQPGG
jgi:hypothetical protein